jgi:hypothetical protein
MARQCDRCNSTMAPGRPRVRVGGKQLWCQTCVKDKDAPSGRYRPGTDIAKAASSDPDHPSNHIFSPVNPDFPVCTKCNFEEQDHPHLFGGPKATECSVCGKDWSAPGANHDSHSKGKYEHLMVRDNPVPDDPSSLWGKKALLEADMNTKMALTATLTGQRIIVVAHDSGDGQTIYHCPFCGSGQVIARSDKTIECEFCHTSFTVQVQPEYSAFPQTMDGQPVQVPGMPGQIDQPVGGGPQDPSMPGAPDPAAGAVPGADPNADPNADANQDGIPDAQEGFDPNNPAGADNQPPWLKKGLRTEAGKTLPLDEYVRHLAIKHAGDDRPAVLRSVRASRSQS